MLRPAACGSWKSPITTRRITAGHVSLFEPRFGNGRLFWLEGRPESGGRVSIVGEGRRHPEDLVGAPYNVRTRVHEYGGGAWALHGGTLFFSDFDSGRLYRKDPDREAFPITPPGSETTALRYADLTVTPDGEWIVCVRETHTTGGGVTNDLALLPARGSAEPRSLVGGHDFFSFPRISPNGRKLVWTTWDHPRMPWDGTDLWVADFFPEGHLGPLEHCAGGPRESVFQPEWGTDSTIFFASDRSGWWNLYAWREGTTTPLFPAEAEFGVPQWVFGLSRYAVLDEDRLAAVSTRMGEDQVVIIDPRTRRGRPWKLPYTTIVSLTANSDGEVAMLAASPSRPGEIVRGVAGQEGLVVVQRSLEFGVSPEDVSRPEHFEFSTGDGDSAFAFFYPPQNADHAALPGERPPLIVTSHGGPTSSTGSGFNLSIQYWTSRGFAVVDVNYRGSSGYGRAYRDLLKGAWGAADVEDCVSAARSLAASGRADPTRMVIRGKSASGLTTLGALVFHQEFAAGASYYGVADLESLVGDTHKFESRYLDGLIGPYPEAAERYRARSPLEHAARLSTPLIIFQGMEDRVVPPSQAEVLVGVLRAKHVPFAYVTFEGEQHGFRRGESIRRALDAELYFYSRILGFELPEAIEPIQIENFE